MLRKDCTRILVPDENTGGERREEEEKEKDRPDPKEKQPQHRGGTDGSRYGSKIEHEQM